MAVFTQEQLEYILQFSHNEKIAAGVQESLNDETLSALWGLDSGAYRAVKEGFAAHARQAALDLLQEADFSAQFDHLPLKAGTKIAAVGDSITDDLQSWAEILRQAIEMRRPGEGIVVANLAVSGDTTTQLVARFLNAILFDPDWLVCMIGTNDARRHGLPPFGPLVSLAETARNLAALRHCAAAQTRARWVWMTPALVVEGMTPQHWFLGPMQMSWQNSDLRAIAELVRRQPDPTVDLVRALGDPVDPHYLLEDGLHPSLEGQKMILRALVARWSQAV